MTLAEARAISLAVTVAKITGSWMLDLIWMDRNIWALILAVESEWGRLAAIGKDFGKAHVRQGSPSREQRATKGARKICPAWAKEIVKMIKRTSGSSDDFDGGFFYDVGVSVGAGGYNYQEDTMLVQYFIKWIAEKNHEYYGDPPESGIAGLKVDGIVGPKTLAAIRRYQEVGGIISVALIRDGRVDPGEATIVTANKDFFASYPNLDPSAPGTWPPPPPLLAAALARVANQQSS
jgi:hypothetical protein